MEDTNRTHRGGATALEVGMWRQFIGAIVATIFGSGWIYLMIHVSTWVFEPTKWWSRMSRHYVYDHGMFAAGVFFGFFWVVLTLVIAAPGIVWIVMWWGDYRDECRKAKALKERRGGP